MNEISKKNSNNFNNNSENSNSNDKAKFTNNANNNDNTVSFLRVNRNGIPNKALVDMKFNRLLSEPFLYVNRNAHNKIICLLGVYVNDIFITGENNFKS